MESGQNAHEKQNLTAGDAVWLATAMLHRESPQGLAAEFEPQQIIERVLQEQLCTKKTDTVKQHVVQHCVANRPPKDSKLRMLWETSSDKRRLFQAGDVAHPQRASRSSQGTRNEPKTDSLPARLRDVVEWVHQAESKSGKSSRFAALTNLIGSGKKLWADEPSDVYVRRLREGW